jgi:hypothetical protein
VPLENGRNQVVLFKSCYPNNAFEAGGTGLTVERAKSALLAVRGEFAREPRTLFVYLTAPPLLARGESAWKALAKRLLGRATSLQEQRAAAARAREFNGWVTSPDGWLAGYGHRNVVAFDYYGLLTGSGSDFLGFPSGDGRDNHPASGAQARAAAELCAFLNRAVRYAGVSD